MGRKQREPDVVLAEKTGCVYCGHPSSEAECEQCGVALESLKILSFEPIVKHRAPVPSA